MIAVTSTGCASTKGYFVDRGRDATDIVTAAVGFGAGAKIRVGPYQAGVLENMDICGLRSGQWFPDETYHDRGPTPYDSILVDHGCELSPFGKTASPRKKSYYSAYAFPFLWLPQDQPAFFTNYLQTVYCTRDCVPYFTQIEVVAGLGLTVRLGFNPGEILDFFTGWFGMDLFRDDVEARKRRTQSNQSQKTTDKAAP